MTIAPTLTWYVCDIKTGIILGELPIAGSEEVISYAAREDSTTFNLPTADDHCPDDWAEVTIGGRSMIVLVVDDWPAQAWVVNDVIFGRTVANLPCVTLETFLHRTNVPDLAATLDTAEAAATLCAALTVRFGVTIEHTNTGHLIDVDYSSLEDRNLLDVLNELRGGEHGAEWRIGVRWSDVNTKQAFDKVLEIRPTIGVERPDVVFDLDANGGGNIEDYKRSGGNFVEGKGATMVIGTSDGAGTTRIVTPPQYSPLVAAGWPVWEERLPFSGLAGSSVQDEDTFLLNRTVAQLAQRERGAHSWTIEGSPGAPVPGRDYDHGDTVRIQIAPQGKRDPYGGNAIGRILGWKLNTRNGAASPIFVEDQEDLP